MELLESVPADGALDLLKAVALKHQAAQGLAVEGIGGLKLPEGEGSLGGR